MDSFNINPSFIKIDVEYMELEVLKGMENTLLRYKPYICIEIHDEDVHKVRTYIKKLNYHLYNICTGSSKNPRHTIDYMCVPMEKHDTFLKKIGILRFPFFIYV